MSRVRLRHRPDFYADLGFAAWEWECSCGRVVLLIHWAHLPGDGHTTWTTALADAVEHVEHCQVPPETPC